jgi:hypothetical protein
LLARPAGGASLPTVTARRVGGTRYPPFWTVGWRVTAALWFAQIRIFCAG